MKLFVRTAMVLGLIWALAGVAIVVSRTQRPSGKTVAAFLETVQLDAQSQTDRPKTIRRVARMLNEISFEERHQLRREGLTEKFFHSLTPAEQSQFLEDTMPVGFKQMMEAFNKMEPQKRREFVQNAIEELKRRQADEAVPNLDEQSLQRLVDQGLRSFYNDASADAKLDLAPLVEQMQSSLQRFVK